MFLRILWRFCQRVSARIRDWRELCSLPEANQKTHDFSIPGWGHAIYFSVKSNNTTILSVMGHGCRYCKDAVGLADPPCQIREGDYLILPDDKTTTRYRVKTIIYQHDPKDMFKAILIFAPRTEEEKRADDADKEKASCRTTTKLPLPPSNDPTEA